MATDEITARGAQNMRHLNIKLKLTGSGKIQDVERTTVQQHLDWSQAGVQRRRWKPATPRRLAVASNSDDSKEGLNNPQSHAS